MGGFGKKYFIKKKNYQKLALDFEKFVNYWKFNFENGVSKTLENRNFERVSTICVNGIKNWFWKMECFEMFKFKLV